MRYGQIVKGKFHSRPNRFIAKVWVPGDNGTGSVIGKSREALEQVPREALEQKEGMTLETVHVKNTGRCKELLLPDAEVVLEVSDNPSRKTKYDLIGVYKEGIGWVNIDSQAPNKVVLEWLREQDYTFIKPEYTYGDSRIDFYMEKGEQRFLMEVKGCTLEIDGIGYFPDAPTERGIKHLKELTKAVKKGLICYAAFVIQMEGIHEVRANVATHKEFGEALEEARAAGVKVLCLGCRVTEDFLAINRVMEL